MNLTLESCSLVAKHLKPQCFTHCSPRLLQASLVDDLVHITRRVPSKARQVHVRRLRCRLGTDDVGSSNHFPGPRRKATCESMCCCAVLAAWSGMAAGL